MPKIKLTLNAKEISNLIGACKPLRARNISIYCVKSEELKFAIGIAKKSLPNSVDRNKVKRILRSIVRPYLKSHKLPSHHIFIIAKSSVLGVDFTELKNEVEQLLLKVIC